MSKLKLHVIFEHSGDGLPHGCSYIRLLLPFTHPSIADRIEFSSGIEYQSADVLVLERLLHPAAEIYTAEKLLERARIDGTRVVYSIDDNLLDAENISLEKKSLARLLAREADLVLVSTENLRSRLAGLNDSIHVIENALDERLFDLDPESGRVTQENNDRTIRIGYMGTLTHDDDLLMVLQALREVLYRRQDQVIFELVGGISRLDIVQAMKGLPIEVRSVPSNEVSYPNFAGWMLKNLRWHIGIAPLKDNELNESKSDIKFLDYSAIGAASVCSNLAAYQDTVAQNDTGLLVDDDPGDWVDAIEGLICDPRIRLDIQKASREYLIKYRTLRVNARKWLQAVAN